MADPYEAFIESRLAAGEGAAHVRRRLREAFLPMASRCSFCRLRKATLLCDYLIGMEWLGDKSRGVRVFSMDRSRDFTCDRRICAECAAQGRHMHGHGLDDEGNDVSHVWWSDYCPDCAKHNPGIDRPVRVVTEDEAAAIRLRMWNGDYPPAGR